MTDTPTTDPQLIAAKVAESEAEVRKSAAEVRKLDLEAELLLATIDKEKASARSMAASADYSEITLKEKARDLAAWDATDLANEVYWFNGEVTTATSRHCMAQLAEWHRLKPGCDIEIRFNSPGGSIVDGMALWDYIQTLRADGHKFTTVAYGYAASMAGILLQAGDVRIMGRESWLLLHEASFRAVGSMGEVKDTVKWVEKVEERILDIFASRTDKITRGEIAKKWERTDWWIDSAEALRLGFIDGLR